MKYNSYYLYKKYEKRDSQDVLPCIPPVYSINGEGTMPKVIHTSEDPECGDIPWQYRWVNMDINAYYVCEECYSYPDRTITGCPYCIGDNRYRDIYYQVSFDSGETWTTTSSATTLYEEYSEDCGYVSPYKNQYFTMYFKTAGQIHFDGTTGNVYRIYYSLDSGSTWVQSPTPPEIQAGQKIMWKGNLIPNGGSGLQGSGTFVGSNIGLAEIEVEGNIMSLLYGDNFADKTSLSGFDAAFEYLFLDLTWLVNAENLILPATTLSRSCYQAMFSGCCNLRRTPKRLPATILAEECYRSMFTQCEKITKAPALYATTLVTRCYDEMFWHCYSLDSLECYSEIPYGDINYYLYDWVGGVKEKGTFYKKPGVVWPRGVNGIPNGWDEQSCE